MTIYSVRDFSDLKLRITVFCYSFCDVVFSITIFHLTFISLFFITFIALFYLTFISHIHVTKWGVCKRCKIDVTSRTTGTAAVLLIKWTMSESRDWTNDSAAGIAQ